MICNRHSRPNAMTLSTRSRVRRLVRSARAALLTVSLFMLVTGCRSFQSVDLDTNEGLHAVETGDVVRVTTKSGAEHEFTVTRVDGDEIAGESAEYSKWQISELERNEVDAASSIGVTALVSVGVYVVLAIAAAATVIGKLA